MADVSELVMRIRAAGANVFIDAGKLQLVNARKLPEGALDFIKRHGKQIADFLETEGEIEERSAIMEHEGGLARPIADQLARLLMTHPPLDVNAADWAWFVGKAAEVVDRRVA